jgi:hypothetical protein
MPKSFSFRLVPLLAAALFAGPAGAAQSSRAPSRIHLTYHGGPMMQNVQVATLFWGSDWKGNPLADYFNGFFQALFNDGRYLANLSQYNINGYQVGAGALVTTTTDDQSPASTVHDAEIRTEIRAQIAAGNLPKPTADTLYFVFMPPQTLVVDGYGDDSQNDFAGYHDYDPSSDGFAYAVIPYDDRLAHPQGMTEYASHELAEAITDPEPGDTTLGWYDDNNGEVGDIPVSLYQARKIKRSDLVDGLTMPDGTVYQVQKEWSNKNIAPVAFAAPPAAAPASAPAATPAATPATSTPTAPAAGS